MELLHRATLAVMAAALVLALTLASRRRDLVRPPWRLALVALASWVLMGDISPLPGVGGQLWLGPMDELLLSFAALRFALWAGLEAPEGLGWWRRPPDLLLQLLMVGGAAAITVVVMRRMAQVDLVGLVTTSAVLTAVLGFAAQGVLKDLIAGLELQLGDDFRVGDWLDLLLAGRVDVLKRCDDGTDTEVSRLGAGEMFGEMTLLLDAPRSATVRASSECDLLQVDRACFSDLLNRNPHLLERLAAQVEERLAELQAIGTSPNRSKTSNLLATMRRLFQDLLS